MLVFWKDTIINECLNIDDANFENNCGNFTNYIISCLVEIDYAISTINSGTLLPKKLFPR